MAWTTACFEDRFPRQRSCPSFSPWRSLLVLSREASAVQREIKFGTISWINGTQNPIWFAAKAKLLDPDWVPKTYIGLYATRNSAPHANEGDFPAYRQAHDFRAMTYCRFKLDVDDATDSVTSFSVLDAFYDGGWTPDFKMTSYPSTVIKFDMDIYSTVAYPGEASPLSLVATQARHQNTALTGVSLDETVLVDALIKFRAGKHTDDIGVNKVGCPWHVPWVWCEGLLTYARGQFKVYGRGSIFPSHAWYLNDDQVQKTEEVGDATFPSSTAFSMSLWPAAPAVLSIPSLTGINVTALNLYPVFNKGVPAGSMQAPLSSETSYTGSVETHPNTVSGVTQFVVVK
jgi:hypothetical protein